MIMLNLLKKKILELERSIIDRPTGQPIKLECYGRKFIKEFSAKDFVQRKVIQSIKALKEVNSIINKKLNLFLFSDILLVTKAKRNGVYPLKYQLNLNEIAILDYLDPKRNKIDGAINIQSKTESIPVEFENMEIKNEFEHLILSVQKSIHQSQKGEEKPLSDKENKDRETRERIILEIYETEKKYIEDLEIMMELYIEPIKRTNILNTAEIKNIFGNAEYLLTLNKEHVFDKIESRLKENKLNLEHQIADMELGDILSDMVDKIEEYEFYCTNQGFGKLFLEELLLENKQFTTFVEEAEKDPRCMKEKLDSFMIKPVQRICRYPLLIQQLTKYTPESHIDKAKLLISLERANASVDKINEQKKNI